MVASAPLGHTNTQSALDDYAGVCRRQETWQIVFLNPNNVLIVGKVVLDATNKEREGKRQQYRYVMAKML